MRLSLFGPLCLLLLLLAVACETVPVKQQAAGSGPVAEGEDLYRNSCARCHALFMPQSYTASEWKFYVRKYGRKARLAKTKRSKVCEYLSANALPG